MREVLSPKHADERTEWRSHVVHTMEKGEKGKNAKNVLCSDGNISLIIEFAMRQWSFWGMRFDGIFRKWFSIRAKPVQSRIHGAADRHKLTTNHQHHTNYATLWREKLNQLRAMLPSRNLYKLLHEPERKQEIRHLSSGKLQDQQAS